MYERTVEWEGFVDITRRKFNFISGMRLDSNVRKKWLQIFGRS
jgi:hypothetical protein